MPAVSNPSDTCLVCGRPPPFVELFVNGPYRLVTCPGCGLVFQHPPPDESALEGAYYHDPEHTAALLGPNREWTLTQAHSKLGLLAATAGPLVPGRALDVGCSSGAWMEAISRRGWTTTGIELGAATASAARARGLDVHTGSFEEVAPTLEQGSFDLITFWDVLEHLRDPARALALAAGLLAPHGVLAATMPNVRGWYPRITHRLIARRTGVWEYPELPVHLYDFSPATVTRLLNSNGYSVKGLRTSPVPYSHYRATTLAAEALGRRPRGLALRGAFAALHVAVYPVARLFDRSNSIALAAVRERTAC